MAQQSALSVLASRVSALTANLSVCSRELTTEVPCLLVACVTTTIAFEAAMIVKRVCVMAQFAFIKHIRLDEVCHP